MSTPRPCRFIPGRDPVPIVQVVGWSTEPIADGRIILKLDFERAICREDVGWIHVTGCGLMVGCFVHGNDLSCYVNGWALVGLETYKGVAIGCARYLVNKE